MKPLFMIIAFFLMTIIIQTQSLELIGPPGGIVFDYQLEIHPTQPSVLYSGTYSGALFKFESDNNYLTPIETYKKDSRITDIGLPPNKLETIFIKAGSSYRSTNNGGQWELIEPTYGNTNFVFNSLNSDVVYMTRRGNEIWRSNNLGATWKKIYTYEREDSTIIEHNITSLGISKIDTSIVYFGTHKKEIFRSTDSGLNWVVVSEGPKLYLAVTVIETSPFNDNTLYLNLDGALEKFKVDSKTTKVLYPRDVDDFAINPQDTLTIYFTLGGFNKATNLGVYKTTDEGNNWVRKVNGIPAEYILSHSIEMNPDNPDELYAGISTLGIYKTVNGGEDWSYTNAAYSDVFTIHSDKENPGTIITGQYGWASMKTTNYGEDWCHPEFDSSYQYRTVYDIIFNPFNKDQGYLLTEELLFITEDRGDSWESVPNDLEILSVLSFHPTIPGLMYASTFDSPIFEGGRNAIYRSTNYGESWQNIRNTHVTRFRFDKNNDNIIYGLGGSSSILHRSSDYGETWEVVLRGDDLPEFDWLQPTDLEVSETNPNNIYISFKEEILLHSADRGENWTRIDSTLKEFDENSTFSDIWLDENNSGRVYVGLSSYGQPYTNTFSNGGLYLTEDNGKNWRKVYDSEVNVIEADNESPRNMYIGTKFGIKTFLDTLTVTSIRNDEEEKLPSEYVLYQNFPNPFNPNTTIHFSLPGSTQVKISVYNLLGQKIATLIDERKLQGNHTVDFNAGHLSSGIYFYKLETPDITITKKMLLMK